MVDVNEEIFLVSKLLAETHLPRSLFFNLEDYDLRAI
jgi:hypothetical protein